MAGEGDRVQGLPFDFAWSSTRPVRDPVPRRVRVPADAFPLIRETSPQEEFILCRVVIRLERPEGAETGTAGILCYLDGQPRRVNGYLRDADYDRAIEAHRERQPVAGVGELVREGRSLVLRNPRGFSLESMESLFQV